MSPSLDLKLTASGSPEDLIAFKGALAQLKQQFPGLDFADRLDLMGVATEFTGAKYIRELPLWELLATARPTHNTKLLEEALAALGITTSPQLLEMTQDELETGLGPSNDWVFTLTMASLKRMGLELKPA